MRTPMGMRPMGIRGRMMMPGMMMGRPMPAMLMGRPMMGGGKAWHSVWSRMFQFRVDATSLTNLSLFYIG